ncbi:hypothetical protein ACSFA3_11005 [Variovorax sp. RHLX14]|uniref:hypothetical protein n=1 Tax=Variovorax sp. RHLX14 TaxID=1259731 RepID=UPI003F47922B
MAVDRSILTPQQRLAISRRALFNQFEDELEEDGVDSSGNSGASSADGTTRNLAGHAPSSPRATKRGFLDGYISGIPALAIARNIGERWWRRHPANAVVQLARPVLGRYARQKPAKLIAIAAGTGALLILIKPWRLLSATALIAAVLKTSDVADMVTSLVHNNNVNLPD